MIRRLQVKNQYRESCSSSCQSDDSVNQNSAFEETLSLELINDIDNTFVHNIRISFKQDHLLAIPTPTIHRPLLRTHFISLHAHKPFPRVSNQLLIRVQRHHNNMHDTPELPLSFYTRLPRSTNLPSLACVNTVICFGMS